MLLDHASVHLNVVMPHVKPVMVVKLLNVYLVKELRLFLMEFVKTVVLNSNIMTVLILVKIVTTPVLLLVMDVMELKKQTVVIQVVKPVLVVVILTA